MCIDAGFDTIEHGTFLTEAQARQMAKKGIAWTPTITAYTYLYEQTKQMIEAGVDMDNPIAARAVHDQAFFQPAFEAYRDNSFIRKILGEHIYVKYLEAKEEEWRDFRAQVTDWEVNQYLYKY